MMKAQSLKDLTFLTPSLSALSAMISGACYKNTDSLFSYLIYL